MKLSEKVINTLESNGFSYNAVYEKNGAQYAEIGKETREGQDWTELITYDGTDEGFVREVRQRWLSFDIDEEAEVWILQRGQRGVPSSIQDILDDAEWKFQELDLLVYALLNMNTEKEKINKCEHIPTIKVRVTGELEIEVGEEMRDWPEADLKQWGYDYLKNSDKTEFDFEDNQQVMVIWR